MGGILSSLLGGGEAMAAESAEGSSESRVHTFHSANRWLLHFNEIKDSNQLVFISSYIILLSPK